MTPERGSPYIAERPEEFPEVPLIVENKQAVTSTPVQFKAQVKDEKGRPLISTPQNENNKIEIPKQQVQLETDSKGSIGEAITWFGHFWLRMIKKALISGKQIFVRRENASN
jgi:maltodextrin utilization protein YvdJ